MKVTYYLGAGASYNAIPIVGELDKAFDDICLQSTYIFNDFEKLGLASKFKIFQAQMQTFSKASKLFGTIDTYAKHLWLTNKSDLIALKESLSFFFTVWQEVDKEFFNNNKTRNNIFESIDHRYLGLFSNYLELNNNIIELNSDVKFITWNYDTQIERALSLFVGQNKTEYALKNFGVYPYNYFFKNIENAQIVHLNGIAGLYATQNEHNTKALFDIVDDKKNIKNVFDNSLNIINSEEYNNQKYFTFAWEDNDVSKKAVAHAEKIMKEAEILVIIGYSFPTFNDQIDKKLINALDTKSKKFKMVYFQDPNASKELLYSRFGIPEKKITIVKDTKQFILPLDSHSFNENSNDGYYDLL